jgi:ubiquinone/menaquinone biosynthesis C-methylase UbiE
MSPFSRLILAVMRAFFYLLYQPLAWTYDWVASAVSLGQWNNWVLSTLPYLTGPRVLELGHGPGHLQAAMMEKGLTPVGLDKSRQMGRIALLRIRGLGFKGLLVNGYAQFMPFADHCFNQVVATFPSPFIFHPDTITEIYRTLIPGGDLIILPAAWITGQGFAERLAAWLFRFTGQAPAQGDPRPGEQMMEPYRKAGFEVTMTHLQLPQAALLLVTAHKPDSGTF